MITIIYSTHKDKEYNDKFNDHLVLTSGLQWVQVLPYVNHNEYSLSELYNKGMKVAQAVLCPVVNGKWVNLIKKETINEKERGENGFGSTGI